MSGCRVLRKYPSLCLSLVVVGMICRPCGAREPDKLPLDDPNAVMKMLLSAVKAIEQPATGRGTATMKIENIGAPFEGKDLTVDFAFKDHKSRVDIFESEAEGRGSRLQAIARSDKGFLNVLQHEVFVDRLEFYPDNVGQDFHPDTFFTFLGGMRLVDWFEYQLDPPEPRVISVELDDDGVLRFSVRIHVVLPKRPGRAAKEYDAEDTITFDTQEGLRPVSFEIRVKYSDGSWYARRANLQWAKFGSAWYVSAFECENLPSNHRHTVGTVKKFSPNVEVSDKEFTLDGMDVPDGMRVNDKIAGVHYRYTAPISLMEDIRDQVMRNERSFNLIKMSYGTQFDYTIPKSELEIERYTAGRKIGGRTYSYNVGIWAQDGVKQHSSLDSYYGPDNPGNCSVSIVNGEVMKQAAKPDLMRGGIDNMEKFRWSRIGPQHLGLRPLGYYKLSELLAPENAVLHKEMELIGDREAYVIDAKRPFKEPPYYARIWIDRERYMPLKIQHYGFDDPSSSNARPQSEVIGIKLHQLPNGGWFPVEGTRVSYRQKPRPHQRLYHIVVDVKSITIQREDIPESLFEINFPEGARIYNSISGIAVEQGKGQTLIEEK